MNFILRIVVPAVASLLFVFIILGFSIAAFGVQNNGALLPALPPSFLNASGLVAANAKLCTTATGTSTPLATYSDASLSTPLPNPITLDSTGRPTTNGSTRTAIYIQSAVYRITLYAAGTGNTCNGTAVGAQIWQQNGVYDLALLQTLNFSALLDDKVCHASQASGANMGARIATCIGLLPATGGTVDARGLEGAQTATANPFSGVTKPVDLILGDVTLSSSATWTIAADNQNIIGVGDSSALVYTGASTTNFIQLTGGGTLIQRHNWRNLLINAGGLASNALSLSGVARSNFDNIRATNASVAGIRCASCVLITFRSPAVSSNILSFSTQPVNGILFATGGLLGGNSANSIYDGMWEGVSGSGIKLLNSTNGIFIGGTSENNDTGIESACASPNDCYNNVFTGIDLEGNTTRDITLTSSTGSTFYNMESGNAVAVLLTSSAGVNRFIGGIYTGAITVEANSSGNSFIGMSLGSMSDSGTRTIIDGVQDIGDPNTFLPDKKPVPRTYGQTSDAYLELTSGNGARIAYLGPTLNAWTAVGGATTMTAQGTTMLYADATGITFGQAADSPDGAGEFRFQNQTPGTGVTDVIIKAGPGNIASDGVLTVVTAAGTSTLGLIVDGALQQLGVTFANLPAGPANGYMNFCTNCQVTGAGDNTCATGGSGAFAFRINGAYRCFALQN